MAKVAAALAAELGFCVFPVDHPGLINCAGLHTADEPCDGRRGEHPAVPLPEATNDPTRICTAFTNELRNIGVACGPSNLLVVDEDEPGEFERCIGAIGLTVPPTYSVRRRGQTQYYFRYRHDLFGRLGNAEIEVATHRLRIVGDDGFVVGEGSTHPAHLTYRRLEPQAPLAPAPQWLVEAMTERTQADRYSAKIRSNGIVLPGQGTPMRAPANALDTGAVNESDPAGGAVPALPHGLHRASDVHAEPVQWLWPGYVPMAKLTVVDGDPGTGKSTVITDLAARVSAGGSMPDGSAGTWGSVLILSAEDGLADTITPRLRAANADLTKVLMLTEVIREGKGRTPTLPDDLPRIEADVRDHGVVLVVIDPLMAYLSAQIDSHRDQDVRRVLHPLARMAESTGAAVVVIRHLNKGSSPNALYRGGGSIGIIGAARMGYVVAPDPDDAQRLILACTKANIAVKPPSLSYRLVDDVRHPAARVEWLGTSHRTPKDLLQAAEMGHAVRRDDAQELLIDELSDGPRPASEVKAAAAEVGIAERTLDRARHRVGVVSRKAGFGKGAAYVWELPDPPCSPPSSHARHPATVDDDGEHRDAEHGAA